MLETNKIYLGDCLDIMKQIDNESIDLILCDPPYGTTKCKWDSIVPIDEMWREYKRITKPNAAIVMTATQPFASLLITSNIKQFKHDWIWNKVTARGHLVAKYRPMAQHEHILVFGAGKLTYNPQMVDRPNNKIETRRDIECKRTEIMGGKTTRQAGIKTYTQYYPKTILQFSNAGAAYRNIHPTQKPVELFEYLIQTYSNPGYIVLDPFMGSGTTAEACLKTGRNYIGIELLPEYHEASINRIAPYLAL
jgi:site-specific DNA-methyltransferase (adenine-specific)